MFDKNHDRAQKHQKKIDSNEPQKSLENRIISFFAQEKNFLVQIRLGKKSNYTFFWRHLAEFSKQVLKISSKIFRVQNSG